MPTSRREVAHALISCYVSLKLHVKAQRLLTRLNKIPVYQALAVTANVEYSGCNHWQFTARALLDKIDVCVGSHALAVLKVRVDSTCKLLPADTVHCCPPRFHNDSTWPTIPWQFWRFRLILLVKLELTLHVRSLHSWRNRARQVFILAADDLLACYQCEAKDHASCANFFNPQGATSPLCHLWIDVPSRWCRCSGGRGLAIPFPVKRALWVLKQQYKEFERKLQSMFK